MKVVFKAPSRFDAESVAVNRHVIERLANSSQNVIVDMAEVELIDGSGFGALAHLHKRLARQKRWVRVVNAVGQPKDLMVKTGLFDVLAAQNGTAFDSSDAIIVTAVQVDARKLDAVATEQRTAA